MLTLLRSSPLLVAALLAPAAFSAPLTIADLAPPEAMVIAGVNDWSQMTKAFDETGLKRLADEPAVKKWLSAGISDALKELEDSLSDVDAKLDDIGVPTGMAGGALWFGPNPDTKIFEARWLLAADYGERADKIEKIVLDLIDRWTDKHLIDAKETQVGDATIHTMRFKDAAGDKAMDDNAGAGGGADADPDADPGQEEGGLDEGDSGGLSLGALIGEDLSHPDALHFARVGGVLVLASDMGAMERAIDRLGGENVRSIADTDSFSGAMAQLTSPHAYAAVFVAPLIDRLNAMSQVDAGGDAGAGDEHAAGALAGLPAAPGAILDALGLSEVSVLGMGLRFDTENAMAELSGGVLVVKKDGLLALLDQPGDAFKPPAFVGADSSGVSMLHFDFAGVVPLLQRVVAAMPPESRAQTQAYMTMVSAALTPLLAVLGPEVVVIQKTERPFGPESEKGIVAIRTTDALTVSNMLMQYSPMIGLARRDFEGHEIWESQQPGFRALPVIGVGAGYVFVGQTPLVEGALRLAGRSDGLRLSEDAAFQRDVARIGAGAIMYSYTEMKSALEMLEWSVKNREQMVKARLNPLMSDLDPQDRKRYMDAALSDSKAPKWLADAPPAATFLKHLGDTLAEVRSTPDGFRWRMLLLGAAAP